MKKLISIMLSALMLTSIFTALPLEASAAKKRVSLKKTSATLKISKKNGKNVYGTTTIKVKKTKGVTVKKTTYSSKNKKIATVSKKGKVTAKKKGSTKITVKVKYKYKKKTYTQKLTFKVKVKDTRTTTVIQPTPVATYATEPTAKPTEATEPATKATEPATKATEPTVPETTVPETTEMPIATEKMISIEPEGFAPMRFTNFDGDFSKLKNEEAEKLILTYSPAFKVDMISTYHWNDGKGAEPGEIWVTRWKDDKVFGPYKTTGRAINGVENAIWDAKIDDLTIEAGERYFYQDSDPSTHSCVGNYNSGIFEIRGYEIPDMVGSKLEGEETFDDGKAAPAKGEVVYNGLTADFGDSYDGNAILLEDKSDTDHDQPSEKVYDMLLDGNSEEAVKLSLDAPKPAEGEGSFIQVGIPVKNDEGEDGTLWLDLEAQWKDGKATAEIYPSAIQSQLEDASLSSNSNLKNNMVEAARTALKLSSVTGDTLEKLEIGVDITNGAIDFFDKGIKMIRICLKQAKLYNSDHFMLCIPTSLDKVTDKGAANLLKDLEFILEKYSAEYNIHRTKWPMTINVGTMIPPLEGGDALFTTPLLALGGRVGSNQNAVDNSYMKIDKELLSYQDYKFMDPKYDESTVFTFSTISHELFHFVQRNYVSQGRTSRWFDESSATYAADVMVEALGEKKYFDQNYGTETRMQFDMLRKYLTIPKREGMDPDYISPVLFDFLMKKDEHAIRKIYELLRDGSIFSSWDTVISKATGISMKELTADYYCSLKNGALFAKDYDKYYIYRKALDPNDHDLDALVDVIDLTDAVKYGSDGVKLKVGAYGVHFFIFDPSTIYSPYDKITLTTNPSDVAIDMWEQSAVSTAKDDYSWIFDSTSTETNFNIPTMVFAIVNGSSVSYTGGLLGKTVTLNIKYEKYSDKNSGFARDNSELLSDSFATRALIMDGDKGRLKYLNSSSGTAGESHATISINGEEAEFKLYDENGELIYSGILSYNKNTGLAKNIDCSVQLGTKKSDGKTHAFVGDIWQTDRRIYFSCSAG